MDFETHTPPLNNNPLMPLESRAQLKAVKDQCPTKVLFQNHRQLTHPISPSICKLLLHHTRFPYSTPNTHSSKSAELFFIPNFFIPNLIHSPTLFMLLLLPQFGDLDSKTFPFHAFSKGTENPYPYPFHQHNDRTSKQSTKRFAQTQAHIWVMRWDSDALSMHHSITKKGRTIYF